MQAFVGDMTPAVYLAEHRTLCQTGQADPGVEGLHCAQAGQCRALEGPALQLPVAFAAAQVAGHALAGGDVGVFDAQVDQFVGAKAAPKPQQYQAAVTRVAQQGRLIAGALGIADGGIEPVIDLLEHCQFQGACALFCNGVDGANAFEDLMHQGGFRGIWKTLVGVPP
ncbi:hypothetical protein D9M73_112790 [compost metagenome]